jgi:hypothetical protein
LYQPVERVQKNWNVSMFGLKTFWNVPLFGQQGFITNYYKLYEILNLDIFRNYLKIDIFYSSRTTNFPSEKSCQPSILNLSTFLSDLFCILKDVNTVDPRLKGNQ